MKNCKLNIIYLMTCIFLISLSCFSQDSIVIQPGPSEGKDAMVHSYVPNSNFGNGQSLIAAAWTYQGNFGIIRGLFEFDLEFIPSDTQIQEAYLNLYYNPLCGHEGHGGDNSAWIRKIESSWDENLVCWNNQPGTNMINQVSLPPSSDSTQNYLEIPVTDLVQDMISNPAQNSGFQLRIQMEETYRSLTFASSDHPVSSLRPMLVIIPDCDLLVAYFTYEADGNYVEFTDSSMYANSWYWDFGDGYFSTLQHPTHYYEDPGEHEVCLTVYNECGSDTVCNIVRVGITGLGNKSLETDLIVSPNPVHDFAELTIPFNSEEKVKIVIFNNLYQVVYLDHVDLNNNRKHHINCSSLQPGVYYVNVISTDNKLITKLIVQ